eukprot:CAMPEP_0174822908 /NCGR_PEP_ID=MMETSP1107-20130205/19737_1 /TAXON_ID=36770 /ORGANISM="Paraphysomonas vestita, Strain GFlagA" /LENGTH=538 /DNA_ID=CAMNT_0016043391 /DNA_START=454 /DNA_END=2070 /DNA_ORIENTATION=-
MIENLSCCVSLQVVNFSRNAFSSVESIKHLTQCSSIENVDLTNNNIEGDVIREVFQYMPKLVALSINGNPATQVQSFRKIAITSIPKLAYLDRPVDELERIGAEAFIQGGIEAEKEAKEKYREKQKQDRLDEMNAFREWQQKELERRKGLGELGKRSYVSDFTPEEIQIREAEAKKAADDEKKMLALGIGKIGARFWQMQGQNDSNGDPLQRAVDSLLAEENNLKQSNNETYNEEIITTSTENNESFLPPLPPTKEEEEKEKEKDVVVILKEEVRVQEIIEEIQEIKIDHDNNNEEEVEQEEQEEEGESQDVRDQRVAESVRIYLYQQEQKREKLARGLTTSNQSDHPIVSSTWEGNSLINHLSQSSSSTTKLKSVYWTEWMDMKLAEFVRSSFFDFSVVADSFHSYLTNDEFFRFSPTGTVKHEEMKFVLRNLTSEDCRLRWAELDASRWSVQAEVVEEGDAIPIVSSIPIYKVCIQPEVLGKGHGAQPSYQAMASMVSGTMPAYLKVPVSFPSTSEYEEDADGDETENGESLENLD